MRVLFYGGLRRAAIPYFMRAAARRRFRQPHTACPGRLCSFYAPRGGGEGAETNLKAGLRV